MFYASVTFQKKDYKSNEQVFQFTEASTHDKPDLAVSLKAMTNSYEIKVESNNTVVTDEWSEKAPDILWDLLDEKNEGTFRVIGKTHRHCPASVN